MDKQAVIRRVRIAVSMFFGVLALALCVLWVRSYFACEYLQREDSHTTVLGYYHGIAVFNRWERYTSSNTPRHQATWEFHSQDHHPSISAFRWTWESGTKFIRIPFWLLVLFTGVLTVSNWVIVPVNHFSLRALLVATTLVAIVLGLGVWFAR